MIFISAFTLNLTPGLYPHQLPDLWIHLEHVLFIYLFIYYIQLPSKSNKRHMCGFIALFYDQTTD